MLVIHQMQETEITSKEIPARISLKPICQH